jgi:hypothetical protein
MARDLRNAGKGEITEEPKRKMMSAPERVFCALTIEDMKAIIYLIGTMVLVLGVVYGMYIAGVPQSWLIVAGLVIGGLGIMGAAREHLSSRRVTKTELDSDGRSRTTETKIGGS